MDGIFLVNKEYGMTSHDVVYKIKKKFNLKKVGHTGTLDPFATGLLIICVGKATKLSFLFDGLDKSYEGRVVLNKLYDTYDITGKLILESDVVVKSDELKNVINSFDNISYDQKPPMYSAIKINGQKMYDLARKGIEVDIPKRHVTIYELKMTDELKDDSFSFYAHVSKGTYIRSLAVDIGEKLDTVASLASLRRTSIGSYQLIKGKKIDDLEQEDLISDRTLFEDIQTIELDDYRVKLVLNGTYLDERQFKTKDPFIVQDKNKNWIAYYEPLEDKEYTYRPVYIF